jgi:CRISPR-associated protein Csm2
MKLTEENYVEIAEKTMQDICNERDKKDRKIPPVTTSKIRNLLAMTADIYNEVINSQNDKLSNEIMGRINYLKIRFVYEAGREPKVKTLVTKAEILQHIDEIKDSRKQYILFSRYMEALVAYRKFLGGHDE